jgi:HEAT repeat protein
VRFRRIIVLVLAGAVVLGAGLVLSRSGEPNYRGKTLSQWLVVGYEHPTTLEGTDESKAALLHIGTNGIPCLMEWLRYEPSSLRRGLFRVIYSLPSWLRNKLPVQRLVADKGEGRARIAVWTLHRLGPGAAMCIPELTQMTKDRGYHVSGRAIEALASFGQDGLPPMLAALSDPKHPARGRIASEISNMPDLGTNGVLAVPVLVGCLKDGDAHLATASARALGRFKLEPSLAVPSLIGGIGHTNYAVRMASAHALAQFGKDARTAVPALLAALDDPEAGVQRWAAQALSVVAPEDLKRDSETRTHNAPVSFHAH